MIDDGTPMGRQNICLSLDIKKSWKNGSMKGNIEKNLPEKKPIRHSTPISWRPMGVLE